MHVGYLKPRNMGTSVRKLRRKLTESKNRLSGDPNPAPNARRGAAEAEQDSPRVGILSHHQLQVSMPCSAIPATAPGEKHLGSRRDTRALRGARRELRLDGLDELFRDVEQVVGAVRHLFDGATATLPRLRDTGLQHDVHLVDDLVARVEDLLELRCIEIERRGLD